jgi:hypothetical protein
MLFKPTFFIIYVALLAIQVTAKGQERRTIRRKRELLPLVNPYLSTKAPVASTKSPTPAPTKSPKTKSPKKSTDVAGAIQTSSGNQMQVTTTVSVVAAALLWLGL